MAKGYLIVGPDIALLMKLQFRGKGGDQGAPASTPTNLLINSSAASRAAAIAALRSSDSAINIAISFNTAKSMLA